MTRTGKLATARAAVTVSFSAVLLATTLGACTRPAPAVAPVGAVSSKSIPPTRASALVVCSALPIFAVLRCGVSRRLDQ